jgi:Tfp pilus assembly PilM family ATPase
MKPLPFKNGASLYIEIRQSSLRVLHGEHTLELPIERQENGRLTEGCRERLVAGLQNFLHKKSWQPRLRALCAIGSRGVSLRRMTLPAAPKEELYRLVNLQIESEFPLPPDSLAWGYRQLSPAAVAAGSDGNRQELLVVAVKKEVVEEYAELFSSCGIAPQFTLAALARSSLCHHSSESCAVLDIGRKQSELISFKNGAPVSIRIIPWGGENVTRLIEQNLGIGTDEAEKLKIKWDEGSGTNGEVGRPVQDAIGSALDFLATAIGTNWSGEKLYLTGRSARYREMPAQLAKRFASRTQCERLESIPDHGRSAAILGLKKSSEANGGEALLVLRLKEAKPGDGAAKGPAWKTAVLKVLNGKEDEPISRTANWKLAVLALALALASLCFPFAEALLLKNRVAKKLATLKADKVRLATIDRELSFLQNLKNTQPPYLDALSVLANASQGGKLDSISMNRRGDLSLRGTLRGAQQVTDFRNKLIQSGFFSAVSVDEQTPSPDRQKFTIRMTAQWKPLGGRERAVIDPSPEEIEKLKARSKDPQFAMPPDMGMPPGMMPPGMPGGPMPPKGQPGPGSAPKNSPGKKMTKGDIKLPPGVTVKVSPDGNSGDATVIIDQNP